MDLLSAPPQISYAEQPLQEPTRALGAYGLKDGDVVVLRQVERRPPAQPAFPGTAGVSHSTDLCSHSLKLLLIFNLSTISRGGMFQALSF